ncbi:methyltransferase [Streptomyces sp. NPDC001985]|uniref:methyltransferase n=1 Tax=Streptomyces sp. NPDC001985 TaxID=3154406 RepID=UPI0033285F33
MTSTDRTDPAGTPMDLFRMITGHYVSGALHVAAGIELADRMAPGAHDYRALARATGTHPPALRRLLRFLASVGVVHDEGDDHFSLTGLGGHLRANAAGSLRAVALHHGGPTERASWGELLHSVRSGGTAFEYAYGESVYAYLAGRPAAAEVFDRAMDALAGPVAADVVEAYDFTGRELIVDVGGGKGGLLTAILRANPAARGIVFDAPQVIDGTRGAVNGAGLAGRCRCAGGDFFDEVPAGGDVYLLKSVIHNWDDDRAGRILRNCRRAMAPDAVLLLVEIVLPGRVRPGLASRTATGCDLNMLVHTGGRERTGDEYRALLDSAGLSLRRIVPAQSGESAVKGMMSIVEGVPQ